MQWNQSTIRRLEQSILDGGPDVDLASALESIAGVSTTKAETPAGRAGAELHLDARRQTSIQAACDAIAARATGAVQLGGTVILSEGVWTLTSTVSIQQQGLTVAGMGPNTVIKWAGAAGDPMFDVQDATRVTFRDMTILGNNTNPPSAGIYFEAPTIPAIGTNEQLTVERVRFGRRYTTDTTGDGALAIGVRLGGAADGNNDTLTIRDCQFELCSSRGVSIENTQSTWNYLENVLFNQCGTSLYCIGSVTGTNLMFNRSSVVDISSTGCHVTVHGYWSEHAEQLWDQNADSQLAIYGGKAIIGTEMSGNTYWADSIVAGGVDPQRLILNDFVVEDPTATGAVLHIAGSSSATIPCQVYIRGCNLPSGDSDAGYVIDGYAAGTPLHVDIQQGTYWRRQVVQSLDAGSEFNLPNLGRLNMIDLWNGPLFDGGLNMFVTGQNTANRTTTATVAAGLTVIPLDSVTNVTAGVCLLSNYGTVNQQVHRVVSVAALNVTVADPVVTPLTNGQLMTSLWANPSHLSTDAGFQALGIEIAYAKDADGAYLIQGTAPKVTLLGNSWFALGATRYEDKIHLRIPGATVVNVGVGGNTSAMMLARFDTDVPADSDYVVFNEPGVNDVYQVETASTQALDIEQIVAKTLAIGAVPIYLSPVPLSAFPSAAIVQNDRVNAQIGDGTEFPLISMAAAFVAAGNADLIIVPEDSSVAVGGRGGSSLAAATGTGANTGMGDFVFNALTTGVSNVAMGRQTMWKTSTGSLNTAVGQGALGTNVVGAGSTAVGQLAGFASLANSNTFVGKDSGYSPNGVTANATTTGTGQTFIGQASGQGSATQRNFATCLGYKTTVDGAGAVAIGVDSGGAGAAATAANEIALGTANHIVQIRGGARVKPRVGTVASSATPTINTDTVDLFTITALAAAITSMTTNLTGTPNDGQPFSVAITDNGTPRAITWGASFEAGNATLPTTTVASTRLDVDFRWNAATSKWRCQLPSTSATAAHAATHLAAGTDPLDALVITETTTVYETAATHTVWTTTRPTTLIGCYFWIQGPGSGGGSGRRGAAGTVRGGGGGGAPGMVINEFVSAADLPSGTFSFTIAAAVAGGAAVTANDTGGNAGANAATLVVGPFTIYGPTGAGGGTTSGGTAGGAVLNMYGAAHVNGTIGGVGTTPPVATASTMSSGTGGGAGSGITTGEAVTAGSAGGAIANRSGWTRTALAAGTAGAINGGTGGNGLTPVTTTEHNGGTGGGGGGADPTAAGGAGGNGGRGSGGGGGAASTNGANSGKGGDGGLACVQITQIHVARP